MIYDFLGKKMTGRELQKELIMNNKINVERAEVYLNAQRKLNAIQRMEKETDPYRKALMEELISHREYCFDKFFGEE